MGSTAVIGPELADIITEGAAMVDDAEAAVLECRTAPDPSSDLARTCGRLVSRYLALARRVQTLPPTPATRRVYELLNYHMEIVAQASMLAFRPHDSHWGDLAAGFGDDLGFPATELRRLAADVTRHPDTPVLLAAS